MSSEDLPRIDVTPAEWKIIRSILEKNIPKIVVWAFGSRATGKAKKFSDLDLALVSSGPLPSGTLLALKEAFAESDLPYKVDLVDWSLTAHEFQKIIEQQHIAI